MGALPLSILTTSDDPPQFDVTYQLHERAALYVPQIIDEAIRREVLL